MYSELKKIYDKTRLDVFSMVTIYLMDIGYQTAKEITDRDIESCEGNGLMTADFQQYLMKLARDIAKVSSPCELIQLCQEIDLYEIPEKVGRVRLEQIVQELFRDAIVPATDLTEQSYIEPEELVKLGYWTEEDLEEYYEEKYE